MSKKITKKNQATKWFNNFAEENKIELLIQKTIMDIACQIKQEREKQGLSQRDIAQKTGLTQTTILRLEKGKNSSLQTLIRVAKGMELDLKLEFDRV